MRRQQAVRPREAVDRLDHVGRGLDQAPGGELGHEELVAARAGVVRDRRSLGEKQYAALADREV